MKRVKMDSITSNELGDPNALIYGETLLNWKQQSHLSMLNLIYDLTPIDFVQMVITEVGVMPPTSVPVIIREYRKDVY